MYVDKLDAAVLAGLLAVIVVAVFFVLQPPTPSSSCTAFSDLSAQLDCFAWQASNASRISACLDASLPDACAGLYAFRSGSIAACDSWAHAQSCQYYYFSARLQYSNVTQEQGIAACRTLSNATWRLACLDRHAQVLKNSLFCHEMDIEHYRDLCLYQVSQIS